MVLNRLKIVTLFNGMLLAFWLAFSVLGAFTWWGLHRGTADLDEVHKLRMGRAEIVSRLALNAEGNRSEMLRMFQHDPAGPLVSVHDHDVKAHLDAYAKRRQNSDELRKKLKNEISDPAEAKELAALEAAWDAWRVENNKALEAVRKGSYDSAVMGAYLKAGRQQYEALTKAFEHMSAFEAEQAARAIAAAEGRQQSATWTFVVLALACGVPGTLLCAYMLRRLARGFAQANAVTRAIADGDLTQGIVHAGHDEIGQLASHLEAMRDQLKSVISRVRHAADSIEVAAGEVAAGNQDLSQRTELTASSLQQTAGSAQQLGATVRQNADHAQQANQLAEGASQVVVRGGDAVTRVVETMRGIHDSSSRIADIIGVIDGIAFQTNILALNAAVEAARAGEQGRGFAVVAAEVRSLAQRSAAAAREIKTLIQASVERVEDGTRQANDAGTTMQEVVQAINRVTGIVGEISRASAEQSRGVADVGDAVHRMDEATQQNAALVEQSAAAAASLRAQAKDLVSAVAAFRVAAS